MATSHFLVKMQSEVAKPALDRLIIQREKRFEEFLQREILFVKQCYQAGTHVWWRRLFRIGMKIPSDSEIRQWLLTNSNPAFWRGYNPRVMQLAHEKFGGRAIGIRSDLKYAHQLLTECEQADEIDVCVKLAEELSKV